MVGLAENKATQPSLAGALAELGNKRSLTSNLKFIFVVPVAEHIYM